MTSILGIHHGTRTHALLFVLAMFVVSIASPTAAQGQICPGWEDVNPLPRSSMAMAFDSRRGVTVMFGGYASSSTKRDTWEWDGSEWTLRSESGPPPSSSAQMVFDSARGVCVLVSESATWEWDGRTWHQRTAGANNRQRRDFALAYDAARQRVVLFGGYENPSTYFRDTWTWDGQAWQQVATVGPPVRLEPAMAYDPSRQRVVMFGGKGFSGGNAVWATDTWEWDGTSWTQTSTIGPPGRKAARMTYNHASNRVMLLGGLVQNTYDAGLWSWDGAVWVQQPSENCPARASHGFVEDSVRNVLVCFGGEDGVRTRGDTRELSTAAGSGAWTIQSNLSAPSPRRGASSAYDSKRGVIVLFGGTDGGSSNLSGETWEWNGDRWLLRSTTGPAPRTSAAMCYDRDRGVCVLYGGYDGSPSAWRTDTWEWDGASWTQRANLTPARNGCMVYDEARHVSIFYGAQYSGGTPQSSETLAWDGQAWLLKSSTGPAPRINASMAYDPDRAVVVLHGGYNQNLTMRDTWEWNGVTWQLRQQNSLFARYYHGLVYDRAGHRMLGLGGVAFQTPFVGEGWMWDAKAGDWQQIAEGVTPGRLDFAMAYDEARHEVVRFGGTQSSAFSMRDDTCILDLAAPPMIPAGTPRNFVAFKGRWAGFHVNAVSGTPPTYQWRHDGIPLHDGGDISGSQADQLNILNVDFEDEGVYDLIMSNDCGDSISDSATLTVRQAGDVDGDKHVGVNDLLALIAAWGPCPSTLIACPADFEPLFGDGNVDVADLLTLILNWGV